MPAFRLTGLIFAVAGACTTLGLACFAAWWATGREHWLTLFFNGPAIVLMVSLAALQAWLAFKVRHAFLPDEPLHGAWGLLGASAVCDLFSAVMAQWLSSGSPLNPLRYLSGWSPSTAAHFRQLGLCIGGTFRYALLAGGLLVVLRIYRKTGFLGRLAGVDWVLLGLVAIYLVEEIRSVAVALSHGKSPSWHEVLNWPVDPLLCLLLLQTRLLSRSIARMGSGAVARCWKAFTIAVLLVWLGDLGIAASTWSDLSWQWASLSWYLWVPAAAAFAAAPAYQLEAIAQAMNER